MKRPILRLWFALALEEFTAHCHEKLPWIPWCHCELKSTTLQLHHCYHYGHLLAGFVKSSWPTLISANLVVEVHPLNERPTNFQPRRDYSFWWFTPVCRSHNIIMCHQWVWPANIHQKEETIFQFYTYLLIYCH